MSRSYWWDFALVLAGTAAGSPTAFTATATTGPPCCRRRAELALLSTQRQHNARLQVFGGTLNSPSACTGQAFITGSRRASGVLREHRTLDSRPADRLDLRRSFCCQCPAEAWSATLHCAVATNLVGGRCGTESPWSGVVPWWHWHPPLIQSQLPLLATRLLTLASTASSKTGAPRTASSVSTSGTAQQVSSDNSVISSNSYIPEGRGRNQTADLGLARHVSPRPW